jgi:hypothetical protein
VTGTDERDATSFNEGYYDRFWADCPDFARYNPGSRHRRRIITELLCGVLISSSR